jgi:hypothetical protein
MEYSVKKKDGDIKFNFHRYQKILQEKSKKN